MLSLVIPKNPKKIFRVTSRVQVSDEKRAYPNTRARARAVRPQHWQRIRHARLPANRRGRTCFREHRNF